MGYCRYIRHYEWRYNDRNDCGIYHIHHSNNEGTEEFEGLRVMCYERADVFIVCYSLAKPASASNVRLLKWIRVSLWADEPFSLQALRKWIPEVRRHRPSVPVVLVATQASRCHKHHERCHKSSSHSHQSKKHCCKNVAKMLQRSSTQTDLRGCPRSLSRLERSPGTRRWQPD